MYAVQQEPEIDWSKHPNVNWLADDWLVFAGLQNEKYFGQFAHVWIEDKMVKFQSYTGNRYVLVGITVVGENNGIYEGGKSRGGCEIRKLN